MRHEIRVDELAPPLGHYTDAVRFGNLLFISGVAPVDQSNRLVGEDDVVAQTRQVFLNMEKILKAAGAGADSILKITVYLTDVSDAAKIGAVRRDFFGSFRPASTLVGVSELAIPGMRIEIEAVAGVEPAI